MHEYSNSFFYNEPVYLVCDIWDLQIFSKLMLIQWEGVHWQIIGQDLFYVNAGFNDTVEENISM